MRTREFDRRAVADWVASLPPESVQCVRALPANAFAAVIENVAQDAFKQSQLPAPSYAPISWREARAFRLFVAALPGDRDSGFGVAESRDAFLTWYGWRFARKGAVVEAALFAQRGYSPPSYAAALFERLLSEGVSTEEIKRAVRRIGYTTRDVSMWFNVVKIPYVNTPAELRSCKCLSCGRAFTVLASTGTPRTCGRDCLEALQKISRVAKQCVQCSIAFTVAPSQAKREVCSLECRHALSTARKRERKRLRRLAGLEKGYTGDDRAELISRLTSEQKGLCAVCLQTPDRLVLDHCHDTGRARAMLCNGCNTALGMAGESAERLRAVARYAEQCAITRDDPITIATVRAFAHDEGWTAPEIAEAAGVRLATVERWLLAV